MAVTLHDTLERFDDWCVRAFAHMARSDPDDALNNMRKAGEAACKALIIDAQPPKRAEQLIAAASGPRELVRAAAKHADIRGDTLLWLEALRTFGNTGSHDDPAEPRNARIGIEALRSLAIWLYEVRLRRHVPQPLLDAMAPAKNALAPEPLTDNKALAEELLQRVLQEQQAFAQRQTSALDATAEAMNHAYGEDIASIKQYIQEERAAREAAAKEAAAPAVTAPPAKDPARWKWIVGAGLALSIGLVGLWELSRTRNITGPIAPLAIKAITVPPGGINVLILPFAVLQDDPNVRINFEEALRSRMEQRIRSHGLPVKVIVGANPENRSFTLQEAGARAEQEHAALVLYGDVFEPTATDSGKAEVHYILSRVNDIQSKTMGMFAFRSLADSMAVRVQSAAIFMMDLALANQYMRDRRTSDALAVLYATTPITAAQQHTCVVFRAQCHLALGDKAAALREAERCVAEDPTDVGALSFLGRAYLENGDPVNARDCYHKALDRDPKNPFCMIDLARVLGDVSSPATLDVVACEKLVRSSLALDTTNALAWQFMGDLDLDAKRFNEARDDYAKSLALAPANPASQVNLADLLSVHFDRLSEAEALLSDVLQRDSTNGRALFMLANLYFNNNEKPDVAAYLFKKSKEKRPDSAAQSLYGQGLIASRKNDHRSALDLFHQSWIIDSSRLEVGEALARTACMVNDRELASTVAMRCLAMDSMAHHSNFAMGFVNSTGDNRNDARSIRFFERAMCTDPYDNELLEALATLSYETGNLRRSEAVFRKLLDLEPRNVLAMRYLITILRANGDMAQAAALNTKALAIDPNDDVLLCNQAIILAASDPARIEEAIALAEHAVARRSNAENLGTLCEVLLQAGSADRALEVYRKAISTGEGWRNEAIEKELSDRGRPL